MNNRLAFTDFVRGLLTINPLERWSPQQAKLHPFITQAKFTGPFVPPMNLKTSSINKTPAPGVQQQQQAEALSKQRAQAAQAQAQTAAQTAYANMQMNHQYPSSTHAQQPLIYSNNMYSPHQQPVLPPYSAPTTSGYGHQLNMMHPAPPQMATAYGQQQNLYAQATTRAGRQRASTMDQQASGIPAAIQRVASHLDPNAPIRLQPSPAYYPPPQGEMPQDSANSRRRGSRPQGGGARSNRNFVQTLEDRTLEEGFMSQPQWH
jgi:dual specificity protein kinase YAK1